MGAVKGILRFGIYFFIGIWMFALGVIVGRGNSPVTFDTDSFQVRLAAIVQEFEESAKEEEKVDLQFYNVLNNPVRHEVSGKRGKPGEAPGEIVPKKEVFSQDSPGAGKDSSIGIKTSKKYATLKSKVPYSPGASQTIVKPSSGTSVIGTKPMKKVVLKKTLSKSSPAVTAAKKDLEKPKDLTKVQAKNENTEKAVKIRIMTLLHLYTRVGGESPCTFNHIFPLHCTMKFIKSN